MPDQPSIDLGNFTQMAEGLDHVQTQYQEDYFTEKRDTKEFGQWLRCKSQLVARTQMIWTLPQIIKALVGRRPPAEILALFDGQLPLPAPAQETPPPIEEAIEQPAPTPVVNSPPPVGATTKDLRYDVSDEELNATPDIEITLWVLQRLWDNEKEFPGQSMYSRTFCQEGALYFWGYVSTPKKGGTNDKPRRRIITLISLYAKHMGYVVNDGKDSKKWRISQEGVRFLNPPDLTEEAVANLPYSGRLTVPFCQEQLQRDDRKLHLGIFKYLCREGGLKDRIDLYSFAEKSLVGIKEDRKTISRALSELRVLGVAQYRSSDKSWETTTLGWDTYKSINKADEEDDLSEDEYPEKTLSEVLWGREEKFDNFFTDFPEKPDNTRPDPYRARECLVTILALFTKHKTWYTTLTKNYDKLLPDQAKFNLYRIAGMIWDFEKTFPDRLRGRETSKPVPAIKNKMSRALEYLRGYDSALLESTQLDGGVYMYKLTINGELVVDLLAKALKGSMSLKDVLAPKLVNSFADLVGKITKKNVISQPEQDILPDLRTP